MFELGYETITDRIAVLLPRGYLVELLKETQNDIICDWRKIKIRNNQNEVSMCIYQHYDSLSNDDIFSRIIIPAITTLATLATLEKGNTMTRKEAVEKIQRIASGYDKIKAVELCNALEVIGLIKFNEPESKLVCASYDGDVVRVLKTENCYELYINGQIRAAVPI